MQKYTEQKTMTDRQIVISEPNARVLRNLLRARNSAPHDQEHLHELSAELDRALVMDASQMSPTVVTLRATVRVRDLDSGQRQELTVVGPSEADVSAGRISILAPLGTALIGYREGDIVERLMPGGPRRLLIEEVLQAPLATHASVH
jgi:regulator of nucleoside diphosphate kinase